MKQIALPIYPMKAKNPNKIPLTLLGIFLEKSERHFINSKHEWWEKKNYENKAAVTSPPPTKSTKKN